MHSSAALKVIAEMTGEEASGLPRTSTKSVWYHRRYRIDWEQWGPKARKPGQTAGSERQP